MNCTKCGLSMTLASNDAGPNGKRMLVWECQCGHKVTEVI